MVFLILIFLSLGIIKFTLTRISKYKITQEEKTLDDMNCKTILDGKSFNKTNIKWIILPDDSSLDLSVDGTIVLHSLTATGRLETLCGNYLCKIDKDVVLYIRYKYRNFDMNRGFATIGIGFKDCLPNMTISLDKSLTWKTEKIELSKDIHDSPFLTFITIHSRNPLEIDYIKICDENS